MPADRLGIDFTSDVAARTLKPPVRRAIAIGTVLLALAVASSCGYAAHPAVSDNAQATQTPIAVPMPSAAPAPNAVSHADCGSHAECGSHT